ncbi:MAG: isochorismatase family cysteine hydrolase [Rhodococcus sp. (in: high G+C Gram-positive bacteria)]
MEIGNPGKHQPGDHRVIPRALGAKGAAQQILLRCCPSLPHEHADRLSVRPRSPGFTVDSPAPFWLTSLLKVNRRWSNDGLSTWQWGSHVVSALVVVDPLNDFVSRRGKGWPLLREVAGETGLVANLRTAIGTCRSRGTPVVYAPHSRASQCGVHEHPTPNQDLMRLSGFFDGFGGKFHPELAPVGGEFVATPHHVSSGFGGTDLDAHLRSIGVDHISICGLLTNTCIESTARQGVDLGYRVSVLTDAVASWTPADHEAAVRGSLPLVVHELITTAEFAA